MSAWWVCQFRLPGRNPAGCCSAGCDEPLTGEPTGWASCSLAWDCSASSEAISLVRTWPPGCPSAGQHLLSASLPSQTTHVAHPVSQASSLAPANCAGSSRPAQAPQALSWQGLARTSSLTSLRSLTRRCGEAARNLWAPLMGVSWTRTCASRAGLGRNQIAAAARMKGVPWGRGAGMP